MANVDTWQKVVYYEFIYGPIDHPILHTVSGIVLTCYAILAIKVIADTWNIWRKNVTITGSPIYVVLSHDLFTLIPYRMYQIRNWMEEKSAVEVYVFLSVYICAVYFLGRLIAIRAYAPWRVTTVLQGVQFMTGKWTHPLSRLAFCLPHSHASRPRLFLA